MKKVGILIVLICINYKSEAQHQGPVHWEYRIIRISASEFEVHMKADLDEGWHIYAQAQPESAVAVPTKILFAKNPVIIVKGKPREMGKLEKQNVAAIQIEQNMYEKDVDFVQLITLRRNVKSNLTGTVTYQACTDEMCLPSKTISFNLVIE